VSVGDGSPGDRSMVDARDERVAGSEARGRQSPGMISNGRATGPAEVAWVCDEGRSATMDRNPWLLRCFAGERNIGVSAGLSVPDGASRFFTTGCGSRP
jgi:hypothetical protein